MRATTTLAGGVPRDKSTNGPAWCCWPADPEGEFSYVDRLSLH